MDDFEDDLSGFNAAAPLAQHPLSPRSRSPLSLASECPLNPGMQFESGTGITAAAALNALYSESSSVSEMFPGKLGVDLQEALFAAFELPRTRVTIPFFGPDGKTKAITRHEVNMRRNTNAVKQMCNKVLQTGNVPEARGQPFAVMSGPGENDLPYRMISYGSLSEAVYMAFEMQPENKLVMSSVHRGLPNARILHHKTPRWALQWLKDFNNSMHDAGGSGYSWPEFMKDAAEIDAAFGVYRKEKGIDSHSCGGQDGYEKLRWKFIEARYKDKVGNPAVFRAAKSLTTALQKMGLYEKLLSWVEEEVDLSDKRLRNDIITFNLHSLAFQISRLVGLAPPLAVEVFGLELMKLCFPGGAKTWHFEQRHLKKAGLIGTSMADSVVFKKAWATSTESASELQASDPAGRPAKRAKAAKTIQKKAKEAAPAAPLAFVEFPKDGTWGSDVLMMIRRACGGGHVDDASPPVQKAMASACSLAARFCFDAEVSINGKVFKAWSGLRQELGTLIAKASDESAAHAAASTADVADLLLSAVQGLTSPTGPGSLLDLLNDDAVVTAIADFNKGCDTPPVMQIMFQKFFAKCWAKWKDMPIVSLGCLLADAYSFFHDMFPLPAFALARHLKQELSACGSLPHSANTVFTPDTLECFLESRQSYVHELFSQFFGTAGRQLYQFRTKFSDSVFVAVSNYMILDKSLRKTVDEHVAEKGADVWLSTMKEVLEVCGKEPCASDRPMVILDVLRNAQSKQGNAREVAATPSIVKAGVAGVPGVQSDEGMAPLSASPVASPTGSEAVGLKRVQTEWSIYEIYNFGPDSVPDSAYLHMLTLFLQLEVAQYVYNISNFVDKGLFHMLVIDLTSKDKAITAKTITMDLRLPFGGIISFTPTPSSFKIGKIFSMPLYLSGEKTHCMGSNNFVPAWSVLKCHDVKKANMAIVTETVTVKLPEFLIYDLEGPDELKQVQLNLPVLTPVEHAVGLHDAVLCRYIAPNDKGKKASAKGLAAKGAKGTKRAPVSDDCGSGSGSGGEGLFGKWGDQAAIREVKQAVAASVPDSSTEAHQVSKKSAGAVEPAQIEAVCCKHLLK